MFFRTKKEEQPEPKLSAKEQMLLAKKQLIDEMMDASDRMNELWAEARELGINTRPWIDWTNKEVFWTSQDRELPRLVRDELDIHDEFDPDDHEHILYEGIEDRGYLK